MRFTFDFTKDQVRELLNNSESDEWYEAMVEILPLWSINTPQRVAGFIAQTAHESNGYRRLNENLNYSAERLNVVFPKYFRLAGRDANNYHRQPEKIANVVYGGRMGNGPESTGDGWKFRGRGIIQLTGKNNYQAFARVMDMNLDEVIEYIETKKGAIDSACWFWDSRNLNQHADEYDIYEMTRLINGGDHGLADRKRRWESALDLFSSHRSAIRRYPQTVKKGSRGETVKKIQEALGITADGIFGSGTEAHLRRWQMENGLVADGIAGPKTISVLLR